MVIQQRLVSLAPNCKISCLFDLWIQSEELRGLIDYTIYEDF